MWGSGSISSFFMYVWRCSRTTYWKKKKNPLFSLLNCLGDLVKNKLTVNTAWEFILGLSILFHWFTLPFLCQYHPNDYYSFGVNFDIGKCEFSNLFLLCKIVLAGLGFLHFHGELVHGAPCSAILEVKLLFKPSFQILIWLGQVDLIIFLYLITKFTD